MPRAGDTETEAAWQRCRAHFVRQVFPHPPAVLRPATAVLAELHDE